MSAKLLLHISRRRATCPYKTTTLAGGFFGCSCLIVMETAKEKQKKKMYKCFRCGAIVPVPEDYIGNSYVLIEMHYLKEHGMDLKKIDWSLFNEDAPKKTRKHA